MIKTISLLLVLLCLASSEYTGPVKFLPDFASFKEVILEGTDHTATVVFDHVECMRCAQLEETIQNYAVENQGFTETYIVDCEAIWDEEEAQKQMPMCDPEHTQQLPMITFFEPSSNTFKPKMSQSKQHNYHGKSTQAALSGFLRKNMPAFRETIKDLEDYQNFLDTEELDTKVILFTNKERTSPLYKAITATFRDRVLFGEVHESIETVTADFNIDSFPAIYLLQKQADGTHKKELYIDDLKYNEIKDFIDDYAPEKKVTRKPKKVSKKKQQQKKKEEEEEKASQNKVEINVLNPDHIEGEVFEKEKPVLVHITKDKETHPLWNDIHKKYGHLFEYYTYDADSEEKQKIAKETLKARSQPGIRFYPPGTTKKPTSQLTFSVKDNDMREIHSEFQYQIADHTITVSDDQQMQMQFQSLLQAQKVVLLYFYESKEVSLSLRVAAMQEAYQKKFGFVSYQNPSEAVRQQFQIQKMPSMVALFRESDMKQTSSLGDEDDSPQEGEEVKVAGFQGKFNYFDISQFLNMWIQMKEGGGTKRKIQEIQSMDDFKKYCQGSTQCFMAILNHGPDKKEAQRVVDLELLKRLNDRYASKTLNFVWIETACHSEILFPFNMGEDELPNMITWSQSKRSIAKMIGRYTRESLQMFVEKALKGQVSYQSVNMEDFRIRTKDCEKEFEKIKQRQEEAAQKQESGDSDIDDEILREILEEERLKRESLEEDGKKKRRKKKKGGKKTDL